mgnify:CR=1 FL=1
MNMQQKLVVAIMDVLMIVELCIAMYAANLSPDSFTSTFCVYFFSMLIPTLVLARILVKRFRNAELEPVA